MSALQPPRPDRPTRYLNEIRKGRENNDLVPTVAG
jgi:hypothetical protein